MSPAGAASQQEMCRHCHSGSYTGNAGKVQIDQIIQICALRSRRMDSQALEPLTDGGGRLDRPHLTGMTSCKNPVKQSAKNPADEAAGITSRCLGSRTSWSGCQTPTFSRMGIPLLMAWAWLKWDSNRTFFLFSLQVAALCKFESESW